MYNHIPILMNGTEDQNLMNGIEDQNRVVHT
jgi:hypothetical protein